MNRPTTAAELTRGTFTEEMRQQLNWHQQQLGPVSVADPYADQSITEARAFDARATALWNLDMPPVEASHQFVIPADDTLNAAACEAVVFRPAAARRGRIFFVHGGGWCFCNLHTHERFMRVLANAAQQEVVGIHYRLAPEHPFPAGLMDVISAYRAILTRPEEFGLSQQPLVIAGDSAGGNLALATLLHEIQAGRRLPAGALILYGALGMDFSTASYQLYGEGYGLSQRAMNRVWNWYLPYAGMQRNPLAVPLLAEDDLLKALPPLFLLAAELDPLASDTLQFKSMLDSLGRTDELSIEPGVVHGFLLMTQGLMAARRATAAAAAAAQRFVASVRS